MKPKIKFYISLAIDLIMLVLFILVMGYHIFDNIVHEIIGLSVSILFIIHNVLNYKWYLRLFKYKYNLSRILKTIVNIGLLICMVCVIISAMTISLNVFKFTIFNNVALGRTVHLVFTIWSFILVSAHLGLHGEMLKNVVFKNVLNKELIGKIINWSIRIVMIALSIYGIYAFISRSLYQAMFNLVEFMFLPFDEPFIKFLFDHFAIVVLFSTSSYYLNKLLKLKIRKEKANENSLQEK